MRPLLLPFLLPGLLAACSKSEPATAPKAGTPGVLRGSIDVKPALKAAITPQHVIFLAARQGTGGGPPMAVKRLEVAAFPLAFELTKDDAMVAGGAAFEGDVELTVRIDGDGNAMSKQPGDLVWKATATIGGPDVAVLISEQLP